MKAYNLYLLSAMARCFHAVGPFDFQQYRSLSNTNTFPMESKIFICQRVGSYSIISFNKELSFAFFN